MAIVTKAHPGGTWFLRFYSIHKQAPVSSSTVCSARHLIYSIITNYRGVFHCGGSFFFIVVMRRRQPPGLWWNSFGLNILAISGCRVYRLYKCTRAKEYYDFWTYALCTTISLERCRSGLSSRFRKPVCPLRVPRVRIPPSPLRTPYLVGLSICLYCQLLYCSQIALYSEKLLEGLL